MHLYLFVISALIAVVVGYPSVHSDARLLSSESETNAGFIPNKKFDPEDQYVDVSLGSGHEFIPPKKSDIRGPCPGLNAAANHGFSSRTGVFKFKDTTDGLMDAFSFEKTFASVLYVLAVVNTGSLIDGSWSIGGPIKTTGLGIFGPALGLSNSHNKYEGDSSPARGDAFLHKGDAHSLVLENYMNLLQQVSEKDNYDMVSMRKHMAYTHEYSVANNPYVFYGTTFFVCPIAHSFVPAFMSNHSESDIGGTLPRHVLNSFFSVKELKNGSLEWIPGHDRIPDNWYKRPSSNPYGIAGAIGDLALSIKENPAVGNLGGNMGKPNSFVGIDLADLTSGVYNSKDILKGNNLACFVLQGFVFGTPDLLGKLLGDGSSFFRFANKLLGGQLSGLACPQITESQYKRKHFNKYPGFTWHPPRQPATPY